jgi:hypothetical protein
MWDLFGTISVHFRLKWSHYANLVVPLKSHNRFQVHAGSGDTFSSHVLSYSRMVSPSILLTVYRHEVCRENTVIVCA